MNDEIVERLESKIAFLEKANTELSDVVYRQQRDIADLQQRLEHLRDRIETLKVEPAPYLPQDEVPPHY
jgi:SlyX protein